MRFILKHDKQKLFVLKPLQQSSNGRTDTIVFETEGRLFEKSDAVLKIFSALPWFIRWMKVFRFLPLSWRDKIYDVIAKNRYRWFGRNDQCALPPAE